MVFPMEPTPRVICCPAELRVAALRQLHAGLPADQQAALAFTLSALDPTDLGQWDGLFVESPAPEAAASTWVQRCPGNTAVVWPPPAESALAELLLQAAADFVDGRAIDLTQFLLPPDHAFAPATLRRAGFERLAELVYMAADVGVAAAPSPAFVPADGVQFIPGAFEQPERLAAIVERTYDGSRDCPALDGARPMDEVLAGYRAQGVYLPEQWHFVVADGRDSGVLILANHPTVGNWELVYMGVAPEARGCGVGEQVVRFALRAAATGGAARLVLAVDAENEPAMNVYRRANFYEWDRRLVYARLRARS